MEIGTVVTGPDSPSPHEVRFVINRGKIHAGQFVEIEYEEGNMIALVTDVVKVNRYFENPESVKEYEYRESIRENFPVEEWEYLVGVARPLCVYREGKVYRPTYPPSPGEKVRIAGDENVKKFLGIEEDGLDLGELEFHDVRVKLNMDRLIRKHFAILAISGAGKSYLATVILEELMKRRKEEGRIGIVVFDVHGEYTGFAESEYGERVKVVRGKEVRLGLPQMSASGLFELLPMLSLPQQRELSRVYERVRREKRLFDLGDLKEAVEADQEMNRNTKGALLAWLSMVEKTGLFSDLENPVVGAEVRPGHMLIIDLSDILDLREKQMIVAYFTRRIFNERREGLIPPVLILVEEAHQFIPEKKEREEAIAREVLETVAREGRKFGVALGLISQRPVRLSSTVLSQCNTHFILRITNPYDLKHVGESSEGIDRRALDMISGLRVGECLVVGNAVNFPVFFRVRERRIPKPEHEKSLEEMAREWEEKEEKREEDYEIF